MQSVVSPTEESKSKNNEKPKKAGLSHKEKVKLGHNIAELMLGFNPLSLPPMEYEYGVLEDDEGQRREISIDDDQVVRYISDASAKAHLSTYFKEHLAPINHEYAQFEPVDIDRIWKLFQMAAKPLDAEIKAIREKSEKGLCFNRLDWDLVVDAPTPTFDEMFSRMTNAIAIKAFIGSLFDHEADRSQYVFIFGEGGNGKGRLIEFLGWALGSSHMPSHIPEKTDRFWLSSITRARLVTFGECDDYGFTSSEKFKAVTGNDLLSIERKGKDLFQTKIFAKFFFASNKKPSLTSAKFNLRRAIYSEIGPVTGPIIPPNAYLNKLKAEGQAFLSKCKQIYWGLCPDQRTIPVEEDSMRDLAGQNEADFFDLIDKYCILESELSIKNEALARMLVASMMPAGAIHSLKEFLARTYQCKFAQFRLINDTGRHRGYVGLGLKAKWAEEWGFERPPQPAKTNHSEAAWGDLMRDLGYKGATGIGNGKPTKDGHKGHTGAY